MVVSSPLSDAAKFDDQIAAKAYLSRSYRNYQNQNFPLHLASLDFLNNYGNGLKRLYGETEPNDVRKAQRIDDLRGRKKLSTEEVMRIAATMFIRSSSSDQSEGLDSLIPHPYDCYHSNLFEEAKEGVKLAESLLACAEKVRSLQQCSSDHHLQSLFDVDKSIQNPSSNMLTCQVQLPFNQMTKFAGIQAMLEKLRNSKKIQIIDLEIRVGLQ